MHAYLKDKVVTKILTDPSCSEYRNEIISLILGLDKNYIKNNLTLVDIRIGSNSQTKDNVSDVIYETEEGVYNIEINYNKYSGYDVKNITYICHLILRQNTIGSKYNKIKPITQININNFDVFNKDEFVYVSKLLEMTYHKLRSDLIQIYDINLNYLIERNYEDLQERLEKLLYIFVCGSMKKVEEVCKGDEVMEKVEQKLKIYDQEFDRLLFYNPDELYNAAVYVKGKEDTQKEVALRLQEQGLCQDRIAEALGLTVQEYKRLMEISK